jgi:hypothetical protein
VSDEDLRRAYESRSRDLVETRTALGDAVAALTAELELRRQETAQAIAERDAALAENHALRERAEHAEHAAHVAAQRPVSLGQASEDLARALRARAGHVRWVLRRILRPR